MTPLSSKLEIGDPVYLRGDRIVEVSCTVTRADGTIHNFTVYLDGCYLGDWSPGAPDVDHTNAEKLAADFVEDMWRKQDNSFVTGLCADKIHYYPVGGKGSAERLKKIYAGYSFFEHALYNGSWHKGVVVYGTRV